jgi:DNA helicase II / ATP-dependent DNA helicase PcrA
VIELPFHLPSIPVPGPDRPVPVPDVPAAAADTEPLLDGLDRAQRAAVTHGEGPLLVVAGPGTGKTQVITRRVAWLIAAKRARPSEILALTFTDRAAAEMQSRVDILVPYGYADASILTFHAYGDRLVREFALELGRPPDVRVLSRADAVVLLREHLFSLGLRRYRPLGDPTRFLGALVDAIARAKEQDLRPEDLLRHASGQRAAAAELDEGAREALAGDAERWEEIAHLWSRYEGLLASVDAIDLSDQVRLALELVRSNAAVRAQLRRRYRFLLVDEAQDTDRSQLELVRLLAGDGGNVTAVGDDDQAIYAFRGAGADGLAAFATAFPKATRVRLRRNHRSRRPILDVAGRLIAHNGPTGIGRRERLSAARRGGLPVAAHAFATPDEEADFVALAIQERLARGVAPGDIAILVRTNADADRFLRSLDLLGIPRRFSGADRLLAQPEVRRLLAALRVAADPHATIDLYAVATAPPYALGSPDLSAILEWGRRRGRSLWAVIDDLEDQPGLIRVSDVTRRGLARLRDDIRRTCALAHARPATEVLYDIVKRSGTLARIADGDDPRADRVLSDIGRFFELVRDRSALLQDPRAAFLVPHLRALGEAGDDPDASVGDDDVDAVNVLTVHKAKGLEFAVVFLVGLVDGRFPLRGRTDPFALPADLVAPTAVSVPYAEERRLAYVAMTRARDELVLTHAVESGGGRARRPSPFLAEALDPAPVVPPVAARRASLRIERAAPVPEPATAPMAVAARLDLSFSQLDDYLTCPARFRYRHVVGLPVPAHHALAYGSALHAAIAAFHRSQQQGEPMREEDLVDAFRRAWSSEGFLSREHEEARFAAGVEAIRRFHAAQRAPGALVPVGVEQEFRVIVEGDRLRGRFDRVDVESDGSVVITDYKSSDVRDPAQARDRARTSLQLGIYALAYEAANGRRPDAVQLHFLDSGVVGRTAVDETRLERARASVRDAAAGMRARSFPARPDRVTCRYCPFREICPSSAA